MPPVRDDRSRAEARTILNSNENRPLNLPLSLFSASRWLVERVHRSPRFQLFRTSRISTHAVDTPSPFHSRPVFIPLDACRRIDRILSVPPPVCPFLNKSRLGISREGWGRRKGRVWIVAAPARIKPLLPVVSHHLATIEISFGLSFWPDVSDNSSLNDF